MYIHTNSSDSRKKEEKEKQPKEIQTDIAGLMIFTTYLVMCQRITKLKLHFKDGRSIVLPDLI
jgi:hypothetical protein